MKWDTLTDKQKETVVHYTKRPGGCVGISCGLCSLHYREEECDACSLSSKDTRAFKVKCSLGNVRNRYGCVDIKIVVKLCNSILQNAISEILEK